MMGMIKTKKASADEVEHLSRKKNFFGYVSIAPGISSLGIFIRCFPGYSEQSFISWINFMYLRFGTINIWPTLDEIDKAMPEDFKAKYPKTRVILDCTELKCQMPSSLLLNSSRLFSSYKNHTTVKGLVGIAPSGAITFLSQLYSGSISDREIVE